MTFWGSCPLKKCLALFCPFPPPHPVKKSWLRHCLYILNIWVNWSIVHGADPSLMLLIPNNDGIILLNICNMMTVLKIYKYDDLIYRLLSFQRLYTSDARPAVPADVLAQWRTAMKAKEEMGCVYPGCHSVFRVFGLAKTHYYTCTKVSFVKYCSTLSWGFYKSHKHWYFEDMVQWQLSTEAT